MRIHAGPERARLIDSDGGEAAVFASPPDVADTALPPRPDVAHADFMIAAADELFCRVAPQEVRAC